MCLEKIKIWVLFSTLVLIGIPCAALVAKTEKEITAVEILAGIDQSSFVDASHMTAEVEMVIRRENRKDKIRVFQVKTQKQNNLVNYLIQFLSPKSIRGSAFMVRGKKDGLPDQYIYLPATKLVRKVAGGNALGSFFGSDFSYGDLMPMPEKVKDDVKLKRLVDAEIGGRPVYRIEIIPNIKGSPYGKLELSLAKTDKMPLKVKYFDPEMKPLKTMTVEKIKLIDGKKMPTHVRMVNNKRSGSTDLKMQKINAKADLKDSNFTQSAMKKL